MMSYLLQKWVFNRCDEKQVHKNQCGMGIQCDSKSQKDVQFPTGAHITLVTVVI